MLHRRRFLAWLCGAAALVPNSLRSRVQAASLLQSTSPAAGDGARPAEVLTLFLCGDLMTGRGIDQILPQPCPPQIYEPFLRDARDYIALAEQVSGPIPEYIWGDALRELALMAPDVRIVNLETAVTTQGDYWPKGINYRMHPANVAVLSAAGVDCCVLANNHVLDWGDQGLVDTLDTLRSAAIRTAGAGRDLAEAREPAVIPVPGQGRVLVFGFGERYSGIAADWQAKAGRPGIDLLPELSSAAVDAVAARVRAVRRPGDLAVASIHWGGNWGYEIPVAQREFAHGLIERAGIDVVHGHSSHHFKGIEVYRGRLILYGCGDFLNDYEGIRGHEEFRPELGFMYFPVVDPADGRLLRLSLKPTRIRRFQVQRAAPQEAAWQSAVLDREGRALGTRVVSDGEGGLEVVWEKD